MWLYGEVEMGPRNKADGHFTAPRLRIGSSAVEQLTLNQLVVGSNPARCTKITYPMDG